MQNQLYMLDFFTMDKLHLLNKARHNSRRVLSRNANVTRRVVVFAFLAFRAFINAVLCTLQPELISGSSSASSMAQFFTTPGANLPFSWHADPKDPVPKKVSPPLDIPEAGKVKQVL